MTPVQPQPPVLATWLYERLASSPTRDALAGDLVEQYAAGRSRAWFWRQVLTAIIVDVATHLRAHPLLALRGLAVGWAVLLALRLCAGRPIFAATRNLRDALTDWAFFSMNWSSTAGSIAVAQLVQLPFSVTLWAIAIIAGWSVGRLHRRQQAPIVLLFTLSVALEQSALWVVTFHRLFNGARPISPGQWPATRALLIAWTLQAIVGLLCMLTAGLWGARAAAPTMGGADDDASRGSRVIL